METLAPNILVHGGSSSFLDFSTALFNEDTFAGTVYVVAVVAVFAVVVVGLLPFLALWLLLADFSLKDPFLLTFGL